MQQSNLKHDATTSNHFDCIDGQVNIILLAATCEWKEEAVGMYVTICNLNMMRQSTTILTDERFLPHPKCDAMTMAPLGIVGDGIDDDGYA